MSEESTETIAFWNCGLAALHEGNRGAENAAYEAAGRTIGRLVHDGAKMLGLCEVSDADLKRLRQFLPRSYTLRSCVRREDRLRWDLALAYDRDVWEHGGTGRRVIARYGTHSYKAGWRNPLRHRATGVDVAIYVAHWRSRLNDGALARERCGVELGRSAAREKCSVLLMGDFNDEPFDKALESLNTSRDIHLVRENQRLLFNPFWRHLGHEDRNAARCGTYFHRNGETTRWRTFDQIIISADFLRDRGLCYQWAGPAPRFDELRDHVPVQLALHPRSSHHDR